MGVTATAVWLAELVADGVGADVRVTLTEGEVVTDEETLSIGINDDAPETDIDADAYCE